MTKIKSSGEAKKKVKLAAQQKGLEPPAMAERMSKNKVGLPNPY